MNNCANCGGIYIGKVVNLDDLCSCVTPAQQTADSGDKCPKCGHAKKMHVVDDSTEEPDLRLWCQSCDGPNQCDMEPPSSADGDWVELGGECITDTIEGRALSMAIRPVTTKGDVADLLVEFAEKEIAQAITDDLFDEAFEFMEGDQDWGDAVNEGKSLPDATARLMTSFARQREQKVRSEFVERVAKEANNRNWREIWDDKREAGYSLQERLSWAMRSVAEEMKGEKK